MKFSLLISITIIFLSLSFDTIAANRTWDGSTNNNWNVASNWSGNSVPTAEDEVFINSLTSRRYPVIYSGTNAEAATITISGISTNGGALEIQAGGSLTIQGTATNPSTFGLYLFSGNGDIIIDGNLQISNIQNDTSPLDAGIRVRDGFSGNFEIGNTGAVYIEEVDGYGFYSESDDLAGDIEVKGILSIKDISTNDGIYLSNEGEMTLSNGAGNILIENITNGSGFVLEEGASLMIADTLLISNVAIDGLSVLEDASATLNSTAYLSIIGADYGIYLEEKSSFTTQSNSEIYIETIGTDGISIEDFGTGDDANLFAIFETYGDITITDTGQDGISIYGNCEFKISGQSVVTITDIDVDGFYITDNQSILQLSANLLIQNIGEDCLDLSEEAAFYVYQNGSIDIDGCGERGIEEVFVGFNRGLIDIKDVNQDGFHSSGDFTNESNGTILIEGADRHGLSVQAPYQISNYGDLKISDCANYTLRSAGTEGLIKNFSGSTATIDGDIRSRVVEFDSGSTLNPGTSPGCVRFDDAVSNVDLSGTIINFEIDGSANCSEKDRITIIGTPDVTGATFNLTGTISPQVGEVFLILDNDASEAVVGTFSGLPEGAIINLNGLVDFEISYVGGNGNDIILTATSVLPVELTEFAVQQTEDAIQLDWITASEIDTDFFQIERSKDAVAYEVIGNTKAAGYSIENRSYQFVDESPQLGQNYYRLKQVDLNGQFEYSEIKAINFMTTHSLKIYPRLTSQFLILETSESYRRASYQLFNALGKVVKSNHFNRGQFQEIQVSDLPRGNYFLKVNIDGFQQVDCIMIQ